MGSLEFSKWTALLVFFRLGILLSVSLAMKDVAEIVWRLLCNICCEGFLKIVCFQLSDTLERNSLGLCVLTLVGASINTVLCNVISCFTSESFQRFPVEISYMPESMKRSSLAHQTDKIVRKDSQEKAEKSWLERNAQSVELRIPIWWLRQMKWKTKLETGSHQTIGLDLVNASEDDTAVDLFPFTMTH
ncbi:DEAD-box ATP-dependent RNA helicase 13 [Sesamum angolense]|uniref:DEAD-box ATP-dependent RNA helicase 13 n=1 Tax=Sesamum angolense TaxID=2727404 RepID=A0AAE1W6C7_9LAMI|nr:DEAD-box ATP-dependent RNA helicase 13 [Sesamum angolense]